MTGRKNKDALFEDLKRRILTLELEPGFPLDETTISEESGLSRTPVREVFQKLAGEGYIRIVGNRGASVSPMNHTSLRDFFSTAPMIYAAIGRLAARNATSEQLDRLREAQAGFRDAVERGHAEDMNAHNDLFHKITGEMSGNQYLLPSFHRLLIDHARIGQTFYRPTNVSMAEDLAQAMEQHDMLIDAIEKRDEDLVASLTLAHWDLSRQSIEAYIHPGPLVSDVSI